MGSSSLKRAYQPSSFTNNNHVWSGCVCVWGGGGGWGELVVVGCSEDVMYLRHRSVRLRLAYGWARPAILVAGKGRGRMFLLHEP